MEEIKNWWGVFGLFGCVTVVSSSLERRCHRQGSLTALTNLRSVAREKGVLLARPRQVCRNGNLSVCALKLFSFFLFLFFSFLLKSVVFCIMAMCLGVYAFPLICSLLLCPLWVDVLVGLVTQSSYTEPVSTPITSTTLVCWNGWRLLFNVLLLLDSRQLYSVSTVPVEPLGLALETSVSYQHYWCSVSVDLWSLPLSGIRHPVSFRCLHFLLSHPFFIFCSLSLLTSSSAWYGSKSPFLMQLCLLCFTCNQ